MIEVPQEFSKPAGFPVEIPDKCRRCVTLARFAVKYADLRAKIETAEEVGISGALPSQWADQVAKVGKMSADEAMAFVASHEPELRAEFVGRLNGMDRACGDQISFAEYVIAHCSSGVVSLVSATEGVAMEAEVCGSRTPERVEGFNDIEIVRVNRAPSANITD